MVSIHCLKDGLELIIGENGRETRRDEGANNSCKRQTSICLVPLHATFKLTSLSEALAAGNRVIYIVTKLVLPVEEVANALPESVQVLSVQRNVHG